MYTLVQSCSTTNTPATHPIISPHSEKGCVTHMVCTLMCYSMRYERLRLPDVRYSMPNNFTNSHHFHNLSVCIVQQRNRNIRRSSLQWVQEGLLCSKCVHASAYLHVSVLDERQATTHVEHRAKKSFKKKDRGGTGAACLQGYIKVDLNWESKYLKIN